MFNVQILQQIRRKKLPRHYLVINDCWVGLLFILLIQIQESDPKLHNQITPIYRDGQQLLIYLFRSLF